MIDKTSLTIWISTISAASAIIAVVLTQMITAYNNRKSDERKFYNESQKIRLNRKIEVGEKFFLLSGENLQLMSALIHYVKRGSNLKEVTSKNFLMDNYNKLHNEFEKLKINHELAGLANLYFDINVNFDIIAKKDAIGKDIWVKINEINAELLECVDNSEGNKLVERRSEITNELCNHYQESINRTVMDITIVRNELNNLV